MILLGNSTRHEKGKSKRLKDGNVEILFDPLKQQRGY